MRKFVAVVTVQVHSLLLSVAYLHLTVYVTIFADELQSACLFVLMTDVLEAIVVDCWYEKQGILSQKVCIEAILVDIAMENSKNAVHNHWDCCQLASVVCPVDKDPFSALDLL